MNRSRLLLVVLAYLAFISLGLPDGLLGVAWPSIRSSFALPLDALGLLLVSSTLGYLISSFNSGRLLRLMSVGTLLALSAAATGGSLLVFSVSPSWWLMVGFGLLLGLGAGAIDAGLNTYVAAHFSTRTMNWLHASFSAGATLGPLIMTAVLGAGLIWRWGYLMVGSAQLLLALTFALTRDRWRTVPSAHTTAPTLDANTSATLRKPLTWLGVVIFFIYAGIEVAAGQWSYSVLTLSRDLPEVRAGLWVTLYWGSLMVGRVVFGFIVNRAPITLLLRSCLLLIVTGALLFWLDLREALTAAGLVLMGLALAPIFPSLVSTTAARLGKAHAANAIGFQVGAAGLGAALIPAFVGVLASRLSLEVVGLALVVSALSLWLLFEGLTASSAR